MLSPTAEAINKPRPGLIPRPAQASRAPAQPPCAYALAQPAGRALRTQSAQYADCRHHRIAPTGAKPSSAPSRAGPVACQLSPAPHPRPGSRRPGHYAVFDAIAEAPALETRSTPKGAVHCGLPLFQSALRQRCFIQQSQTPKLPDSPGRNSAYQHRWPTSRPQSPESARFSSIWCKTRPFAYNANTVLHHNRGLIISPRLVPRREKPNGGCSQKPNTTYYFAYRKGSRRRRLMRAYSANPVQRQRQLAEHPREGVLTAGTKTLGYHMKPILSDS